MGKKRTYDKPPLWANRFLEWYCRDDLLEEVRGDIYESYHQMCNARGYRMAKWKFIWNVLQFFKLSNLKNKRKYSNNNFMFKNYLKTSIRSILRSKVFSLINVLGLALAMTTCFFIFKYVIHERSYDDFHTNGENIYRVTVDRYHDNVLSQQWAAASAAIGPALKYNFPEVVEFVKMNKDNSTLTYNDITFREERAYYANEVFFGVFSYKLISGVDSLVLKEPFTTVLSESTARKYFGNENAVGKTLKLNGKNDLLVTGVFEDVPDNTHMKFDILYSFETLVSLMNPYDGLGNGDVRTSWGSYGFYTYILLTENLSDEQLESKIPALVDREYGEELRKGNKQLEFHLQPLKDIHLNSNYMREFEANGDEGTVLIITIIALFILAIAWVNYVNLATSRAIDRAKEIGVRKVLGSGKRQLVKQFLFEAWVLNVLAAILTIFLVLLLIPEFNDITGQHLNLSLLSQTDFWLFIMLVPFLGAVIAGFYPALVLAQFKPITILKGKFSRSLKGELIRKSLVVFQFVASITLMIGVFVIYKQVDFMRNQDLGIDIEKTLVVKGPSVTYNQSHYDQHNTFKTELLTNPSIPSITVSSRVPGSPSSGNAGSAKLVREDASQGKAYALVRLDYDFIGAYGIEIVAGKNFSKEMGAAIWNSVILNESGRLQLGFETNEAALGQMMELFEGGPQYKVIGIIKDYHQKSLKESFEPTMYTFYPMGDYYSFKVSNQQLPETLEAIKEAYDTFFEGSHAFDYYFLDSYYDQQYKAELQFSKVISASAILAIIIACLGLFGLSTFTISQRRKEIGIRKVLGASIQSILLLLTKSFSTPVVIAFLIAVPISWYVVDHWLENFAYSLNLEWWFFVSPGVVAFLVAIFTLSFQSMNTARANPVEALRDE